MSFLLQYSEFLLNCARGSNDLIVTSVPLQGETMGKTCVFRVPQGYNILKTAP